MSSSPCIAIMQPYLFPYIGYFQLIKASDIFIIHDDVQYIKGGWINRNRILVDGKDYLFTISIKKDASTLAINQRSFSDTFAEDKDKLLRLIYNVYHKAPYFTSTFSLIKSIFSMDEPNISIFNTHSLKLICDYLELQRPIIISSTLNKNNNLKAQDRVINILKCMNATKYINPIGGLELYDKHTFELRGIRLNFLRSLPVNYVQFEEPFVACLSIIDVCMFNAVADIQLLLDKYELI